MLLKCNKIVHPAQRSRVPGAFGGDLAEIRGAARKNRFHSQKEVKGSLNP